MNVKELITAEQYSVSQKEKDDFLLKIIKKQMLSNLQNNKHLEKFYKKTNFEGIRALEEIPPLPVQMFKQFNLD